MKNIDRFWKVMDYGDFDHPPFFMENVWHDTLRRWHSEGLPKDKDWCDVLGVKPLNYAWHGFNHSAHPGFERRTIEETAEFRIYIDESGRTVKAFREETAMPMWLDYPIKDRASFEKVINEQFAIVYEERMKLNWDETIRKYNDPSFEGLILPPAGNYFFTIDAMMGIQTVSMMFFECPDLIHKLFDNICDMCCWFADKFLSQVKSVRWMGTGEDLSFKNGPFFSPDIFDEFFVPRYRRIMDVARKHGVESCFIDSDGNFELFIPRMLELGMNVYCPVEVAAGMDPLALRKKFGKGVRMLGGVDKRIVAEGKEAIKAEMERLFPLMCEGGWVPIIDHSVPSTISWDDFRHYMDTLRSMHARCANRA